MPPQTPWLLDVKSDFGKRSTGTFVLRPAHPTDDDWQHSGRWAFSDGQFVITEFTIRSAVIAEGDEDRSLQVHEVPDKGITAQVLRSAQLGGIIRGVRRWLAGFDNYVKARLAESRKPLPAAEAQPTHKRGRPARSDDYYRLVAELHLRVLLDPNERRTRKRVKELLLEDYGVKVSSEKTVAEHVTEARRREYLTPGQKGTAHAGPGPKLVEYWKALKA